MAENKWEYKTIVLSPYAISMGIFGVKPIWGPTLGAVKFIDGELRENWDQADYFLEFDVVLKELGSQGWELVQIVERRKDNYQVAVFKKQAAD